MMVQRVIATTLDHVVFGVPDLETSIAALGAAIGATPEFGGRHESIGTHNAILPLRDGQYLELIARDPSCPSPPQEDPWGLDRMTEPRLITWAVSTQDIQVAVGQAREAGYDPGRIIELKRETPRGEQLCWRLTIAAGNAANTLIPFLIDWGSSPHPSKTNQALCSIEAFRGEHPDPESVRPSLNALGAPLEVGSGKAPRLRGTLVGPNGSIALG